MKTERVRETPRSAYEREGHLPSGSQVVALYMRMTSLCATDTT